MAFANHAHQLGYDAVIVHFRGCGGVENTAPIDYNAGDTAEALHVFELLKAKYGYGHILASGVSLRANMRATWVSRAMMHCVTRQW